MFGTPKRRQVKYEMEKTQPPPEPNGNAVNVETRIQILFEEYRALYSLLTFRLTAMDRRLPAIGGTLTGILCSIPAMPDETRLAFLLGLPIALLWLFLTTVQHARSKEDHLRRIDEIERRVNELAGEELLVFQSSHPVKGRFPGGRTGFNTVLGTLFSCNVMLAACAHLTWSSHLNVSVNLTYAYFAAIIALAGVMIGVFARLPRYRPRPVPPVSPHRSAAVAPRPES